MFCDLRMFYVICLYEFRLYMYKDWNLFLKFYYIYVVLKKKIIVEDILLEYI